MHLHDLDSLDLTDCKADVLNQIQPLARWIRFAKFDAIDWFRGEPAEYDSCYPHIDRHEVVRTLPLDKRLEYERSLMHRFIQMAAGRLTHYEHSLMLPGDYQSLPLAIQVVMRHRAIPTRLLDWSVSPLVALFFACQVDPSRPHEDGRIRWFNAKRAWVNWKSGSNQLEKMEHDLVVGDSLCPVYLHERSVSKFEPWVTPWALDKHENPTLYPRVREQRGTFTMAGLPGLDHWQQLQKQVLQIDSTDVPGSGTIRVPAAMKRLVREVLAENWNISANTLFPDPEGVVLEMANFSADQLSKY